MREGPGAGTGPLRRYAPPILWMAVIFLFSTDLFSGARTGSLLLPLLQWVFSWAAPETLAQLHGGFRKVGHFTEYAVLAALWYRARADGAAWAAEAARLALFVAVGYAVTDEVHQAFVASRTGSPLDVVIDATGAAAALLLLRRSGTARAALALR